MNARGVNLHHLDLIASTPEGIQKLRGLVLELAIGGNIITLVVADNTAVQTGFRRAVERTLKNKLNHRNNKTRRVEELKGTGTTLDIKRYFFR